MALYIYKFYLLLIWVWVYLPTTINGKHTPVAKKRGLASGRGLDALLGDVKAVQSSTKAADDSTTSVVEVALASLQRGAYQPRRDIAEDSLKELAESIKEHGVMQPIVIREVTSSASGVTHEIIAGERRWQAAKLAGLATIPAIVRAISDDVAIALALIENIQREDLSPMEQAFALQRFNDEFGLSHAEIAKTVGKARATVSNLLRLLSLHEDVQTLLNHGDLDMGHARALLSLPKPQQPVLAKKVVQGGLTVRQTEALVKNFLAPKGKKADTPNPDIAKLSQDLSEKLGALVDIKQNAKGKGKMTIHFHTPDELDGILARLDKK